MVMGTRDYSESAKLAAKLARCVTRFEDRRVAIRRGIRSDAAGDRDCLTRSPGSVRRRLGRHDAAPFLSGAGGEAWLPLIISVPVFIAALAMTRLLARIGSVGGDSILRGIGFERRAIAPATPASQEFPRIG